MPDYTYLKSQVKAEEDAMASDARRKHEEFVDIFNQQREEIVSQLIKDCRETVERYVSRFYKLGEKEYFRQYPPCYGRGIIEPGLFRTDYKLNVTVCHAAQLDGKNVCPVIRTEILSTKPKVSNLIHVSSNWDGDEFFCTIFFPSEQHLNSVIQAVNVALSREEIELYLLRDNGYIRSYHAIIAIRANLGVL